MSFLYPLHPTQSGIVQLLGERRELSVPELHEQLGSIHGLSVSMQNLYRIVSQLVETQVLVRRGGKLSLNMLWVTHLVRFGDGLRRQYLTSGNPIEDLPKRVGQQAVYSAESLMGLDPVWNDTLLHLARTSPRQTFYAFNSHAWYPLGMKNTELDLYRGMKAFGVHPVMIFGDTTFLDSFGLRVMQLDGVETHMRPAASLPPMLRSEGMMISAAGDFVLESILPPAINKHFSFFFQVIQSTEQFDIEMFANLFRLRARCTITVQRNPELAEKWRSVLEELRGEKK